MLAFCVLNQININALSSISHETFFVDGLRNLWFSFQIVKVYQIATYDAAPALLGSEQTLRRIPALQNVLTLQLVSQICFFEMVPIIFQILVFAYLDYFYFINYSNIIKISIIIIKTALFYSSDRYLLSEKFLIEKQILKMPYILTVIFLF